MQDRQGFCGEPGANFAGENEFFVLVVANQNCAEMFARALRRRVSANDEFLFVNAFELDPCAAATPWLVNRVALFAHNSFQAAAFTSSSSALASPPIAPE